MKLKFTAQVLLATLATTSIFTLPVASQTRPSVGGSAPTTTPTLAPPSVGGSAPTSTPTPPTSSGVSFSCVSETNGNVATVGQRPGGQPIPLIIWTQAGSSYFGDKYTPQNRCNIVTQKVNTAVAASGGSLKNVLLTNGIVKDESVICVLSTSQTGCSKDGSNVLFTLKPENARRAGEILAQILKIRTEGSSAGVIRETSSRVQVNLGDWEEQTMGAASSQPVNLGNPATTNNPVTPVNSVTPDNDPGL